MFAAFVGFLRHRRRRLRFPGFPCFLGGSARTRKCHSSYVSRPRCLTRTRVIPAPASPRTPHPQSHRHLQGHQHPHAPVPTGTCTRTRTPPTHPLLTAPASVPIPMTGLILEVSSPGSTSQAFLSLEWPGCLGTNRLRVLGADLGASSAQHVRCGAIAHFCISARSKAPKGPFLGGEATRVCSGVPQPPFARKRSYRSRSAA